MGKVTVDLSMSLDGFITGPNDDVERLHQWMFELESFRELHGLAGGNASQDAEILGEAFRNVGAFVMGRRMFDLGEQSWGDNPPFHMPVYVVTHRAREALSKEGGTTFYFVTHGVESAVQQAQTAAGDKVVLAIGGANIVQQLLKAGLLDEIQLHLVPILLGEGKRLFDQLESKPIELESTRVVDSAGVTHLKFRVVNG